MRRFSYEKLFSLFCAGALISFLAACSAQSGTANYSGQTVTGQVTQVEDASVALQLGELTEASGPAQGGVPSGETPPEKPDGDSGSAPGSDSSSETPPAIPGSNSSGSSTDNQPPELPSGAPAQDDNGSESGADSGNQPPEMPSDGNGGQPGGNAPRSMYTFTAGEETAVFDLSSAAVTKDGESASLSDIVVGDVLTITVDETGTVTAAEIVNVGGGPFGGSSEVTQGSSANTISEDGTYSGTTYTSTGGDENALRVDGATVTLDGVTVDKIAGAISNTENGSSFTGAINIVDNAEGGTDVSDTASVTVESGCTWNLTGNCTLTSLTNNGTINFNGYTITLADGTVLK